ncbi:DUF427-domain-containing protein [Eremomyces bilateralis CBS 781.70]|uniref:DUF427-domain-containing protein n=1 Tax=Eremomyces bilateralis CBS 781.70 TaxID=1392243 RepID=A0A6G1G9S1_9PEZI|nr:DUF427-domain-containing protein [Eremomyces bilateralis CBS 781.70]KAF1814742.1 DUF427-domain-containing protein [Eremomyces bilateralis CBS 781.70]
MSPPDVVAVTELLNQTPFRILTGGKQLTLAFGGLYIASTTLAAKPLLIWETEKGYPRYYIPIESLHADIQSHLASSSPGTSVSLATVDTVNCNGSQAVIERLTVGSKTTPWVRFLEGPLKGHIRFERSEIDDWFENGSIFAGIKNPYKRIDTDAVAHHIVVKVDGEVVAETNVAVLLTETNAGETYYLPATSIKNWGAIEKSDLKTACPYKGESWYFSLTVKGQKHENLIWYYQYPTHESSAIQGLISFYKKDFVELLVDGVRT